LFPFWHFNFYYPTKHRKSFDIDQILDLSIHNKKRKRLSTDEYTN